MTPLTLSQNEQHKQNTPHKSDVMKMHPKCGHGYQLPMICIVQVGFPLSAGNFPIPQVEPHTGRYSILNQASPKARTPQDLPHSQTLK